MLECSFYFPFFMCKLHNNSFLEVSMMQFVEENCVLLEQTTVPLDPAPVDLLKLSSFTLSVTSNRK